MIELTDRTGPVLLVLRALKLGDLLVAVPALHALRRAHPEHRLVLACPAWLLPIVRLVGGVDALLPTPGLDDPLGLAPGAADIAVNLHGSGRESAGLVAALSARRVVAHAPHGVPLALAPEWIPEMHERVRWARLVTAFGAPADPEDVGIARPGIPSPAPDAVVVHIGAFYGCRRWSEESFAAVAARVADQGRRVVLTGSAAERTRAERIVAAAGLPDTAVLAGDLDLEQLAALVAGASSLVSADTGPAHLASAYGVPSVVLFGPAPPEAWGPPRGPHAALTHAELRRGETFSDDPDPALTAVTPEEVLTALRRVEAQGPAGRGRDDGSGGERLPVDRLPQAVEDARQEA